MSVCIDSANESRLQGVAFFHAGSDILRSKSLDRDSYNSGTLDRASFVQPIMLGPCKQLSLSRYAWQLSRGS